MSRNRHGAHVGNKEWGGKDRKREDHQTGVPARNEAAAIAEGLAEAIEAGDPELYYASIADEGEPDYDDYWLEERWDDLYAGTADDYDDFWYDQD